MSIFDKLAQKNGVSLYGERVNKLIRQRYSLSEELALNRQRFEKPEEFAEYYAYCEECKQRAKSTEYE